MTTASPLHPDNLLRLLRDLVRFPTVNPPGGEEPAARFVERELRAIGCETGVGARRRARRTNATRIGSAPSAPFQARCWNGIEGAGATVRRPVARTVHATFLIRRSPRGASSCLTAVASPSTRSGG